MELSLNFLQLHFGLCFEYFEYSTQSESQLGHRSLCYQKCYGNLENIHQGQVYYQIKLCLRLAGQSLLELWSV